jgi:hypothetical protein
MEIRPVGQTMRRIEREALKYPQDNLLWLI